MDGSDLAPLNPDVCEDSDLDTCDDCSVGTDNFGPLPDNDPLNDGPDADADGICDAGDLDTDGDGIGDNADTDDDNDGILDGGDNCTFTDNPDQTDTDGDDVGNACDPDDDNDGVDDTIDNCGVDANSDQADWPHMRGQT